MKKVVKSNPLKTFNDNKALAVKKMGGAQAAFKKSLTKAQAGRTVNTTGYSPGMQAYNKNNYNELLMNKDKGSGYYADKDGMITKTQAIGKPNNLYNKSIDTAGYSKGRTDFEIDTDYDNGRITGSKSIKRSQVIPTINKWKQEVKPNPTKVNTNSSGTKTVVHTGTDGKKYVKVTKADGKTYNKIMKKGGTTKVKKK